MPNGNSVGQSTPKACIRTIANVSSLLEVDEADLKDAAGKVSSLVRVRKACIKGKKRILIQALTPLNVIQGQINKKIFSDLRTPRSIHGYKRNRSNVTHAAAHSRAPVILRYDLKDFFPSIRYQRVFKFFQSLSAGSDVANILTRLTTFRGSLPIGFSTSPTIANQVVSPLVRRLEKFAQVNRLTFTAYADNLEISGPGYAERYDDVIRKIISQEGFAINEKKSFPLRGSIRKELTGVVVNDGPSWGRNQLRNMRARIARLKYEGLPVNPDARVQVLRVLEGYAAYVSSIKPSQGQLVSNLIEALKCRG